MFSMVAQPEMQSSANVYPFNHRQVLQPVHQRTATYPPYEHHDVSVNPQNSHMLMPCNVVPAPPPTFGLQPYMEGVYAPAPPQPSRGYVLNGVKRLHISRDTHPTVNLPHSFFHQYEQAPPPKVRC